MQKQRLVMLLTLAAQWQWRSESEELLWDIVNRYPDQQWAAQTLARTLYAGGRTRSLMQLFSQEVAQNPSDSMARSNLAMTALLLNAPEWKPHTLALEVYRQSPTNASYAFTYAFSLHLQYKNAEALKVIESIPRQKLADPSIAGYYGLILKAVGQNSQARSYLESAIKGYLLPEERRLFERAGG